MDTYFTDMDTLFHNSNRDSVVSWTVRTSERQPLSDTAAVCCVGRDNWLKETVSRPIVRPFYTHISYKPRSHTKTVKQSSENSKSRNEIDVTLKESFQLFR